MIDFRLDRSSGTPTYLQLVHQVRQAVRTGVLQPGDRLPTASEVVDRLAINPNTVLKAYRELDRAGLVVTRQGRGTFVARTLGDAPRAAHQALRQDLRRCLGTARQAGLDVEDLEAVFVSVLHELTGEGVA